MEDDQKEVLTEEQALREKIEKRIKARNEAQMELLSHIVFFLLINIWLFDFGGWINQLLAGNITFPHVITILWGFGLISHIINHSHDHGYGYVRRQRKINEELERQMRLRGMKRKNDDLIDNFDHLSEDQEVYLNEDGEIAFTKKSP